MKVTHLLGKPIYRPKYKLNLLSRRLNILFGIFCGVLLSFLVPSLDKYYTLLPEIRGISPSNGIACTAKPSNWFQEIVNSDYNPIVKLSIDNGSSQSNIGQMKAFYSIKRPRFYIDELDINDKLLIAVATSDQTFPNLGQAFNDTLAPFAEKMIFFKESSYSPSSPNVSPSQLVILSSNRVHDDSNNQETARDSLFLQIINYLERNYDLGKAKSYVQSYDFIFIVSDNSYVKGDMLRQLVDQYSVDEEILMTGSDVDDDDGEDCSKNGNFNLKTGILISGSLLAGCGSNLHCMRNACRKSPLKAYKLSSDQSDNLILELNIFQEITIFQTVFTTKVYYNLHHLHLHQSLNSRIKELNELGGKIEQFEEKYGKKSWPPGIREPHRPSDRFDVTTWTYHEDGKIYMPDDFDVSRPMKSNEKVDLENIEKLSLRWLKTRYPLANHESVKFENAYRRFDANRGMEYILDVTVNPLGRGPFKTRLQIVKPLVPMQIINRIPFSTEQNRVVLMVPVYSGYELSNVISLMNQFMNLCLEKQYQSNSLVVIMALTQAQGFDPDQYAKIKSMALSLQTKYPHSACKLLWSTIRSDFTHKVPNDLAIVSTLWKRFPTTLADAIVVKCLSHTILSSDYLSRVQLNTVKGHQVFFPMPFQEYHLRQEANMGSWKVSKDNGIFLWFDFRHCSFYIEDFLKARSALGPVPPEIFAYDDNYDLLQLFLSYNCQTKSDPLLHILRAVEPELKLKFRPANCDHQAVDKFSRETCNMSSYYSLGSKAQLASLILNYKKSNAIDFN